MISAEQQIRDILERMEIKGAQSFSAGELVELANIISERDAWGFRCELLSDRMDQLEDEIRRLKGYTPVPYEKAMAHNLELVRKARKKGKEYRENHKLCPECKGKYLKQTYVGYFSPPDRNKVWCGCGWEGIVDDLTKGETK